MRKLEGFKNNRPIFLKLNYGENHINSHINVISPYKCMCTECILKIHIA